MSAFLEVESSAGLMAISPGTPLLCNSGNHGQSLGTACYAYGGPFGTLDIGSNGTVVADSGFTIGQGFISLSLTPVPEPTTAALLGLGLTGLAVRRRSLN